MLKSIDTNTIGYRIRLARIGVNLTQRKLAEMVHIGPSYLATVERGSKNASEDLIRRIAAVTHTTSDWILGISSNQTPYPEPDNIATQIKENTATIGYLAELIRDACKERNWAFTEPHDISSFPKTDWMPDYWLSSTDPNGLIEYWAFDLSLCVYKQPDLWGDGTLSPRLEYLNYLSNIIFGNRMIRNTTKYTFAVPSLDIFRSLCKQPAVNLGNASIALIDIPRKKVVREFYLCTVAKCTEYLENELCF